MTVALPDPFSSSSAVRNSTPYTKLHLFLLGFFVSLLIQTGHFGTIDAFRRAQVTHWMLWGEPPVDRTDDHDFGQIGRNGVVHAWYGMGQSLFMIPADLVATPLARHLTHDRAGINRIRNAAIAYLTFPLINAIAVVVSFLLLQRLGFSESVSVLGAIALLFTTTFLHYAQVNQENNQLYALTVAGCWALLCWRDGEGIKYVIVAAICFGFTLLIRIPGLVFLLCGFAVVAASPAIPKQHHAQTHPPRWLPAVLVFGAILACFLAIDRIYQFIRFGSFTSIYVPVNMEDVQLHPDRYPVHYPFNNPFWSGFLGPFLNLDRAIFIYDLPAAVAACLLLLYPHHFPPRARAFGAAAFVAIIVIVAGYARYIMWDGVNYWGDRFVTPAANLLALLAIPLVITLPRRLSPVKLIARVVVIAAVPLQLASVIFTKNLEWVQLNRAPIFVERLHNVARIFAGTLSQVPHETNDASYRQMVHPNFAPFVIFESNHRIGIIAVASWGVAVVATLAFACMLTFRHAAAAKTTPT